MAALPYIQLYVADYLADTAHLSLEEHGAYLLLIFHYWQTGKSLPDDDERLQRVCRANAEQWQRVRFALEEFFHIEDGKWTHHRIESDLIKVHARSEKARKSAESRYKDTNAERTQSERRANAERTHCHTDTDTDTDTKENTKDADASCPYAEIIKIFGEELPTLPQPRTRTASRERSLRARWRENKDRQDVEWWRAFFAYIRNQCDFLMGRAPNQQSPPSWLNFDWLLKPDNFVKVLEGNYEGASHGANRENRKSSLGERAEAIADRHLAAISSRNTDLPVEGNDLPVSPQVDRRYG